MWKSYVFWFLSNWNLINFVARFWTQPARLWAGAFSRLRSAWLRANPQFLGSKPEGVFHIWWSADYHNQLFFSMLSAFDPASKWQQSQTAKTASHRHPFDPRVPTAAAAKQQLTASAKVRRRTSAMTWSQAELDERLEPIRREEKPKSWLEMLWKSFKAVFRERTQTWQEESKNKWKFKTGVSLRLLTFLQFWDSEKSGVFVELFELTSDELLRSLCRTLERPSGGDFMGIHLCLAHRNHKMVARRWLGVWKNSKNPHWGCSDFLKFSAWFCCFWVISHTLPQKRNSWSSFVKRQGGCGGEGPHSGGHPCFLGSRGGGFWRLCSVGKAKPLDWVQTP